ACRVTWLQPARGAHALAALVCCRAIGSRLDTGSDGYKRGTTNCEECRSDAWLSSHAHHYVANGLSRIDIIQPFYLAARACVLDRVVATLVVGRNGEDSQRRNEVNEDERSNEEFGHPATNNNPRKGGRPSASSFVRPRSLRSFVVNLLRYLRLLRRMSLTLGSERSLLSPIAFYQGGSMDPPPG